MDVGKGMGRGMMSGGMMDSGTTDTDALKTAPEFDRAFLEEMIPHHQMAVMMTQVLLSGPDGNEVTGVKNIIDAQGSEIWKIHEIENTARYGILFHAAKP